MTQTSESYIFPLLKILKHLAILENITMSFSVFVDKN